MIKNYDFKEVRIGSFNGICTGGGATTDENGNAIGISLLELNEESIKDIICIIDEENGNAIDISNGNYYHILKRDKNGRIIEDYSAIQKDCFYALSVLEEKKVTKSQIYRMYCNYLVASVVSEYKKKISESTSSKVRIKMLEKKKENTPNS